MQSRGHKSSLCARKWRAVQAAMPRRPASGTYPHDDHNKEGNHAFLGRRVRRKKQVVGLALESSIIYLVIGFSYQ
jgi:hypothetical protein